MGLMGPGKVHSFGPEVFFSYWEGHSQRRTGFDPLKCKTQRDRVEREVGGRLGMGNTRKSMADSCQCMAKITTIL